MVNSNSMSLYASEASCQMIRTDETSEFARVWIVCMTYGLALATAITVPLLLCAAVRQEKDWITDLGSPKAGDEAKEEPAARKESKQRRSSVAGRDVGKGLEDKAPNLEAARAHLKASSVNCVEGHRRGVWSTSVYDLTEVGGVGIELYFRLVMICGIMFAYMSIITAPTVMYNWNGNFLPDTGSALAKTTVGNLGWIAQGVADQENRLVVIGCQGMDIKKLTKWFGYLDACSLVIYTAFMAYFRFRIVPAAAKIAQEETLTVADFSIEIDCLPAVIGDKESLADHKHYEQKLKDHLVERMEQARKDAKKGCCKKRSAIDDREPPLVRELVLVRNYGQRLSKMKERAVLARKLEIEAYKGSNIDKLEKKIKQKDDKLNQHLAPEEELPVVRAYAIVNTIPDSQGLLMHYRFANYRTLRCCQGRAKKFEGSAIRMNRAPEPSNIICENADVSWTNRTIRRGVMFCLWFIAILLAGVLIFAVTAGANAEKGGGGAGNQQLGADTCDSGTHATGYMCNYQAATLWNKTYARTLEGDVLSCYCTTQGYMAISEDADLYNDICYDWLKKSVSGIAIGVGASMVIVILNVVFRELILCFAEQEKPLSVSALLSSKMTKIFGSQFINTAVIIFLLNYHSNTLKLWLFGNGEYGDFERGWYAVVGGAMVTNMMVNSFMGSLSMLVATLVAKCKRCCCRSRMKTQDELIELYTNPQFDISLRFAQLLMTAYCTMLYSSGMPILNLFAAVYCFTSYWADKIVLLKGSKSPPLYDATMPYQASQIMLFAAPIHVVFAIGMFSHLCTFPSDPLGGSLGALSDQAIANSMSFANSTASTSGYGGGDASGYGGGGASNPGDVQQNSLLDRATRESTWLLFLALIALVVLFVLQIVLQIVGATFGEFWKLVKVLICPASKAKIAPSSSREFKEAMESTTWDQAEPLLKNLCPPTSYSIAENPEFAKYYKHLRPDPEDPDVAPAAPIADAPAEQPAIQHPVGTPASEESMEARPVEDKAC